MSKAHYRSVDPHVSWPAMEERWLAWWRDKDVFHRSLAQRAGDPEWVFYEGPPTANGKPGIHHVEARTFKDLFCRFQTMRGHYVHRKAGWDCHGLPVEIEVEKQLGITQKREIEERIGIEEFTRRCRESVTRYVDDWERMTDRIGFWLDLDDAYWTMTPTYIESVWWLLKNIWDQGLLEEDFKVVPYCPRCETSLSSHEQHYTGSYQDVVDPSVYVRFPLVASKGAIADELAGTSLLVWTTTPWTLLANMAAAVGPEITYARVADPAQQGRGLIVARDLVAPLFGEEAQVGAEFKGSDLLGLHYQPPFSFVRSGGNTHTVRAGDFVTTEEGTGVVHLAPYGEDDIGVARRDALEIVQMITPSGRVDEGGGSFAGLWFKDADPKIVDDLTERGLLFRSESYSHAYPHCWRCSTPLVYYARKDFYIRTSWIRDRLQASNEDTNWFPETIKYGRFGDWLANNVDWSLSRDRYWGTPLPVWRCPKEHSTCVGSREELSKLAGRDLTDLDPHRPFVDEVTLPCPECGAEATRVKSVIDAWFDSGAMPFAQWHFPFENEDVLERRFPAHFISEAIDQTRGWFYSLLAIATLVRGRNSYRNCVVLGLLLDAEGRKMSKSLGNVLDPWTVLNAQGADALRWYLLTGGSPWSARRVSVDIIQDALRKYLLTLWNTYSFWVTYAAIERYDPTAGDIDIKERPELDRWIIAELDDTVRVTTDALERFDAAAGGRRLDQFVDDLSNWYVRRSRRRFWRSKEEGETRAAFATLWECLTTLARLTAPFTPFIAEEIHTNIAANDAPESVHLTDWPEPSDEHRDDPLREQMGLIRRLATLGRAVRTDAKLRIRQPLAKAVLVLRGDRPESSEMLSILAEELNVKEIAFAEKEEEFVTHQIKPNFRALGPKYGSFVKDIAEWMSRLSAAEALNVIEQAKRGFESHYHVTIGDRRVELGPDDYEVTVSPKPGFITATDGRHTLALDTSITPELESEGIAREVIRLVQDQRKLAGLEVENRIHLWLDSRIEKINEALKQWRKEIAAEVLAPSVHLRNDPKPIPSDAVAQLYEMPQGNLRIALKRA